jgi:hypothetical protein
LLTMSTTVADLSKDQLKRYHPFQSEKGTGAEF